MIDNPDLELVHLKLKPLAAQIRQSLKLAPDADPQINRAGEYWGQLMERCVLIARTQFRERTDYLYLPVGLSYLLL